MDALLNGVHHGVERDGFNRTLVPLHMMCLIASTMA